MTCQSMVAETKPSKSIMNKKLVAILILMLHWLASPAQQTNIVSMLSPKHRKLMTANPTALSMLTNAFCTACTNKSVAVHYFYDPSRTRAGHYYPVTVGEADVVLCIREDQQPWDEFICIVYELQNAGNGERFGELSQRAQSGSISRTEFATEILRAEFDAMKTTRGLLRNLKLSKKEKMGSYFYPIIMSCPADLQGFLTYTKTASAPRDVMKEYEAKYDAIRTKADAH